MKSLIAGLAILCFYSTSGFAGVENILSMQREASGTSFSVVCDNKGIFSHNAGLTAESIRNDSVCGEEVHVALLEEGNYKTNGDFCGQNVKWVGDQLYLALEAPCTGTLILDKFQEGWYRGKLQGYQHDYEVEVKSATAYVFYSRAFGTQGEFSKAVPGAPAHSVKSKRHLDPTRN